MSGLGPPWLLHAFVLLLAFAAGAGLAHAAAGLAGPALARRLAEERGRYGDRLRTLFLHDLSPRFLVLVRWAGAPAVALLAAGAGQPVLGAILGGVLFVGPDRLLDHLAERRRQRLAAQVLDLTHALAATSRSGMSLLQAIEEAAASFPAPMGQELAVTLERIDAGATLERALGDLDRRLALPGLHLVLRALLIAEARGGDLPRLLSKIARTLMETERVEQRIATETSGVRLASRLMAAMPLLIGVFLYMASPEHVTMLFTTLLGNLILVLAAVFDWLGFSLIRRLGDVEV